MNPGPGSSSDESTSLPPAYFAKDSAQDSSSASSTGDTINAKNSAITFGNSEGNTYNFGETVRNQASSEESPNRPHNRSNTESGANSSSRSGPSGDKGPTTYVLENSSLTGGDSKDNVYNFGNSSGRSTSTPTGFAPGSASASSTGERMIHAVRSVITLGNSEGNTYNLGSKKSSTAPAPQPQSIAPKAEARQQDERGSVVNPISSKEETKELDTDTVPIESGESNASQCISKMDKTPEPVSESFSEGSSDVPVTEKVEEMSIVEPQGDQEAPPSQQADPEMKVSNVGQGPMVAQPSLPQYSMNRKQRGLCKVINNVKFKGQITSRPGSDEDAVRLVSLFKDLDFQVEAKKNQTSTEMLEWFKSVSQSNHSDYDCFACCILTHGELGEVYGADSETLEIQQILELFTGDKCPSLAGKPKLFFIQACQGPQKQEGVLEADVPCGVAAGMPKTIPTEADFLLSCSTVSGYVSVRDTKKGTWYVNELVDQIKKYHKTTDMLNILTIVNNAMCDKVGKIKQTDGSSITTKQVPAHTFTLKKALYL